MKRLLEDNSKFKDLIDYINSKKYFQKNYSNGIDINDENFILVNDLEGIQFDVLNHNRYMIISKSSKEYYKKIKRIYETIEKSDNSLEVIMGNYSIIKKIDEDKYIYPLITTAVRIRFETSSEEFIISIKDGILNFEVEVLRDFSTSFKALMDLKESFTKGRIALDDVATIEWYIKELKYIISNNSNLEENLNLKTLYDKHIYLSRENPISIYKNTVIFMRRAKEYNIDRSFIDKFHEGISVKEATKSIIEEKRIVGGFYTRDEKELSFKVSTEASNLLEILEKDYGVIAEGINEEIINSMVLHLMSKNKRILVTSKSENQLEGLKGNFEDTIKPLIALNKPRSIKENIKSINDMISLNPATFQRNRYALERKVVNMKNEVKQLKDKIEEIEELERKKIKYDGKIYSFDELETFLSIEEKEHNWIEEELSLQEKPPINNNQMIRILYLLDKIPKVIIENTNKYIVNLENIPDMEELKKHINNVVMNNHKEEYYKSHMEKYHLEDKFTINEGVYQKIDEAISNLRDLESSKWKNMKEFYKSSEIGKSIINKIYILLKGDLKRLIECLSLKEIENVELPKMDISLVRLKSYANEIYNEITKKGKLSTYYKLKNSKKMRYISECNISKEAIEKKEDYFLLVEKIEFEIIKNNIKKIWNENASSFGGKEIVDFSIKEVEYLEDALKYVTMIVMWRDKYTSHMKSYLKGMTPIKAIDYWETVDYMEIKKFLNLYNEERILRESNEYISSLLSRLKGVHFLEDLKEAIENRNLLTIDEVYSKYKNYEKYVGDVKEFNMYFDKIKHRLSKTISKIMVSEDKLKYKDIMRAWHFKQLKTLKSRIDSLGRERTMAKLQSIQGKISMLNKEILINDILAKTINSITIEKRRELWNFSQFLSKSISEKDTYEVIKNQLENLKKLIPVWFVSFEDLKNNDIYHEFHIAIVIDRGDSEIDILPQILSCDRVVIFKEKNNENKDNLEKYISKDSSLEFLEEVFNKTISSRELISCKDIEISKVS